MCRKLCETLLWKSVVSWERPLASQLPMSAISRALHLLWKANGSSDKTYLFLGWSVMSSMQGKFFPTRRILTWQIDTSGAATEQLKFGEFSHMSCEKYQWLYTCAQLAPCVMKYNKNEKVPCSQPVWQPTIILRLLLKYLHVNKSIYSFFYTY